MTENNVLRTEERVVDIESSLEGHLKFTNPIHLKISVRTVETHRSHLTNKLGIKKTAGLVKYALSKGDRLGLLK